MENAKNYNYCRCVELHCAPPRGAPGFLFCCSPCQPGQKVDYADPLPESSELFIDYQAFFPSYDLAPSSPLIRQQVVSLYQYSCVSPVQLIFDRRGRGWCGEGAKSYKGENAWSSINHSILSAYRPTLQNLKNPIQQRASLKISFLKINVYP